MNSVPKPFTDLAISPDERLDSERYEQGWNELMASFAVPPAEYLTYHKRRFFEVFEHLAFYLQGKPSPRVLEIGASPFTRLYKAFFPHIQLVTIDRPVALNGFDAAFLCGECGAERYYGIDLNRESIGPEYGEPHLGTFDYILFTEILEHLVINPVQLFGELLSLLAPNGLLYLTTPNFFAFYRLGQLAAWENPQGNFPRRGEDAAAAYHFREYTMLELLDFFTQAGGEIVKAYFSDCWDDPSSRQLLERTPQCRADLMVVVCRPGAEIVREATITEWRQYAIPVDLAFALDNPSSQEEMRQLRQQVQGYESGRVMRAMKWLHTHGLPHF